MNRFVQVDTRLTVSDQLTLADLKTLKEKGITTVVRNRPDNEEPGQLTGDGLARAAQAIGLTFIDQPVSFSTLRAADGARFAEILTQAKDEHVHAFCRTGRRCVALWALANAKEKGAHAVVAHAATLGEDLRGLAPLLAEMQS
jgi:uncharacterized protein (TIGR01244 family)